MGIDVTEPGKDFERVVASILGIVDSPTPIEQGWSLLIALTAQAYVLPDHLAERLLLEAGESKTHSLLVEPSWREEVAHSVLYRLMLLSAHAGLQ